jgi:replicative DNA helicase
VSLFELPSEHFHEAAECELALVGACIVDPTRLDAVGDLVTARCFHNGDLGGVFDLLCDLRNTGKPITDPTLLTIELRRAGLIDRLGGSAWIARAVNQTLAHHAAWYASQVVELSRLRVLHSGLARSLAQCCQSTAKSFEIAQQLEAETDAAMAGESSDVETMASMLDCAIDEIDNAMKLGQQLGLSTQLPTIDRETGGFFPGDVTILAARPSIGKSAFVLDLAARVAELGKSVLIVSLEMTKKQIAHRLLNRETGIPIRRMQKGELSQDERKLLDHARTKLKELPLKCFVSCNASVARIRARARVQLAQDGLDLLIIDYLQLIVGDKRHTSYERITAISRDLKALAIELNRPVLALSQLNRESAKSKFPTLEHLRDSGAIEQDADNVWLLHRESREDQGTKLIVAKQRQGPVGTIELLFDATRMRFKEPEFVEWVG